jgi:hypothetical protein
MATQYGFRKIYTTSGNYANITPTVGTTITFDPNASYDYFGPYFGNVGFFLSGVNGYMENLDGDTLIVVSFDDTTLVNVGDPNMWFVPEFKIEYVCPNGFDSTFLGYFDLTQIKSDRAYAWAMAFKDYDDVVNYITQQQDMSYWVEYARRSDYDRFAPSIVDQEWIYFWATELDGPGFFEKLTDQSLIFSYAMYFPDREATVKPEITDPYWIDVWNQNFLDDPIILPSTTPYPTYTPTATATGTATPTITPTPSVTETPTTG